MSERMNCDCGWSGALGDPPGPRPRCPDCHAPLDIPPLPPDPLAGFGPAPIEEPSAAVRLARRRRQARESDDGEASQATAEADHLFDEEEAAPRRQRYRSALFLSPRTLRGLALLLFGGIWLAIDLSRDKFPVFSMIFLSLGAIMLIRAFRGAEEA